MHPVPPVPHGASPFNHADQLFRYSLCKTALSASSISPLRRCRENPLHCRSPSLSLAKRHWYLQGDTTTCGAFLTSNAHERSNRVNGKGKVQNRVEREVRRRRCTRKERPGRVNGGNRRCTEVLED